VVSVVSPRLLAWWVSLRERFLLRLASLRAQCVLRRVSWADCCAATAWSAAAPSVSVSASSVASWARTPSLSGYHQLGRHGDLLALPGDADAIVGIDHRGGADQAVTAAQQLRADRALGATGRRLELAGRIRRSPASAQVARRRWQEAPARDQDAKRASDMIELRPVHLSPLH
jgi:hypothetical protein